jgi:hypothetical protein
MKATESQFRDAVVGLSSLKSDKVKAFAIVALTDGGDILQAAGSEPEALPAIIGTLAVVQHNIVAFASTAIANTPSGAELAPDRAMNLN